MVTAFSISIPRENSKGSEGRKKNRKRKQRGLLCFYLFTCESAGVSYASILHNQEVSFPFCWNSPNVVKSLNLDTFDRDSTQALSVVMGALYSSCMFLGVNNASSVQPVVSIERTVFYREKAAGMFSPLSYAVAQVTVTAEEITASFGKSSWWIINNSMLF